ERSIPSWSMKAFVPLPAAGFFGMRDALESYVRCPDAPPAPTNVQAPRPATGPGGQLVSVIVRAVPGRRLQAFAIDAFLAADRRREGGHAGGARLVVDTLEMALLARAHHAGPVGEGLVHHSVAGSQSTSFAFTRRLSDAGADPWIGSIGDAYDTLAESTIGLYKTELVKRSGHGRRSTKSS